jgi:hypothetical protein
MDRVKNMSFFIVNRRTNMFDTKIAIKLVEEYPRDASNKEHCEKRVLWNTPSPLAMPNST